MNTSQARFRSSAALVAVMGLLVLLACLFAAASSHQADSFSRNASAADGVWNADSSTEKLATTPRLSTGQPEHISHLAVLGAALAAPLPAVFGPWRRRCAVPRYEGRRVAGSRAPPGR